MKSIHVLLILALFPFGNLLATNLSKEEKSGIQLMREEEKLAHDVYLYLYEKWELPIFSNISNSETRHFEAIGYLIENFNLVDNAKNEFGKFNNFDLQNLYDSLTQKGSESLISALEVGAFIEEVDIADLQRVIENTSTETVKTVYQNLLRASGNHIRAFTRQLENREHTYSPVVLDKKNYQAILNTLHQHGNGNCVLQQNSFSEKQVQGKGKMRRHRSRNN